MQRRCRINKLRENFKNKTAMQNLLLISLGLTLFLIGCKENKKVEPPKLGQYVYIDSIGCMHVQRECINFILHNRYNVKFKELSLICDSDLMNVCSHCVTDDIYVQLKTVAKSNK